MPHVGIATSELQFPFLVQCWIVSRRKTISVIGRGDSHLAEGLDCNVDVRMTPTQKIWWDIAFKQQCVGTLYNWTIHLTRLAMNVRVCHVSCCRKPNCWPISNTAGCQSTWTRFSLTLKQHTNTVVAQFPSSVALEMQGTSAHALYSELARFK